MVALFLCDADLANLMQRCSDEHLNIGVVEIDNFGSSQELGDLVDLEARRTAHDAKTEIGVLVEHSGGFVGLVEVELPGNDLVLRDPRSEDVTDPLVGWSCK